MVRLYVLTILSAILAPNILFAQCDLTIDAGPDLEVCPSDQPLMNGSATGTILHAAWLPATGLTSPQNLQSMISQPADITYQLQIAAYNENDNLLTNGDFEQGDTGFTSQYLKNNTNPGGYIIGRLGTELFAKAKPCKDHTSTSGNMMMVKISNTVNLDVYCQEVEVIPNRNYHFTAFATAMHTNNPPLIILEINGEQLSIGTLGSTACSWQKVKVDWNSGNNTTANICVNVSDDDIGAETDFALDDLGFYEVCDLEDEMSVSVIPLEVRTESGQLTLPCGDSILLAAEVITPANDYSAQWTTGEGHLISGEQSLNPLIDGPGTYTLEISLPSSAGICREEISIEVEAISTAQLNISEPEVLNCFRPQVELIASHSGAPSDFIFQWSTPDGRIINGEQSNVATVDTSGTYTLTLTEKVGGCSRSQSVEVLDNCLESFSFEARLPDCGQPIGSVRFGEVSGGLPPYFFSIDDGSTFSSNPQFSDLPQGTYSLVVQDSEGCELHQTLDMPGIPQISILLSAGIDAEPGKKYPLSAAINLADSLIAAINWSPATGLSCSDCLTPELSASQTTTYQLTVTDIFGCQATAALQVTVRENTDVYIPNVFSPNNDGRNDIFLIFGDEAVVLQINELAIFDRYGTLVFSQKSQPLNDQQSGWTGIYKGSTAPEGVYVYLATIEFRDGHTEIFKGEVFLLR